MSHPLVSRSGAAVPGDNDNGEGRSKLVGQTNVDEITPAPDSFRNSDPHPGPPYPPIQSDNDTLDDSPVKEPEPKPLGHSGSIRQKVYESIEVPPTAADTPPKPPSPPLAQASKRKNVALVLRFDPAENDREYHNIVDISRSNDLVLINSTDQHLRFFVPSIWSPSRIMPGRETVVVNEDRYEKHKFDILRNMVEERGSMSCELVQEGAKGACILLPASEMGLVQGVKEIPVVFAEKTPGLLERMKSWFKKSPKDDDDKSKKKEDKRKKKEDKRKQREDRWNATGGSSNAPRILRGTRV